MRRHAATLGLIAIVLIWGIKARRDEEGRVANVQCAALHGLTSSRDVRISEDAAGLEKIYNSVKKFQKTLLSLMKWYAVLDSEKTVGFADAAHRKQLSTLCNNKWTSISGRTEYFYKQIYEFGEAQEECVLDVARFEPLKKPKSQKGLTSEIVKQVNIGGKAVGEIFSQTVESAACYEPSKTVVMERQESSNWDDNREIESQFDRGKGFQSKLYVVRDGKSDSKLAVCLVFVSPNDGTHYLHYIPIYERAMEAADNENDLLRSGVSVIVIPDALVKGQNIPSVSSNQLFYLFRESDLSKDQSKWHDIVLQKISFTAKTKGLPYILPEQILYIKGKGSKKLLNNLIQPTIAGGERAVPSTAAGKTGASSVAVGETGALDRILWPILASHKNAKFIAINDENPWVETSWITLSRIEISNPVDPTQTRSLEILKESKNTPPAQTILITNKADHAFYQGTKTSRPATFLDVSVYPIAALPSPRPTPKQRLQTMFNVLQRITKETTSAVLPLVCTRECAQVDPAFRQLIQQSVHYLAKQVKIDQLSDVLKKGGILACLPSESYQSYSANDQAALKKWARRMKLIYPENLRPYYNHKVFRIITNEGQKNSGFEFLYSMDLRGALGLEAKQAQASTKPKVVARVDRSQPALLELEKLQPLWEAQVQPKKKSLWRKLTFRK